MMRYLILVLLLSVLPVTANAYTAGDLQRDCKLQVMAADRTIEKEAPTLEIATAVGACIAYIDATAQVLSRLSSRLPVAARVCLPQNYAVASAIGHYISFMDKKPESRGRAASEIAMTALAEAYPCH